MTIFSIALLYIACGSEDGETTPASQPQAAVSSQPEIAKDNTPAIQQTANNTLAPLGDDGKPPPLGDQATGVRIDLSVMKPQMDSEEISDPVVISGTIAGDCTGDIRIDANENDIDIPEGKPLPGPLVAITLTEVGPFSFNVPKGKSLSIVAFCDQNKDQKIGQEVDLWTAEPRNLGKVESDQSDLEIKLVALSASIQQKLPPIDKANLPTMEPQAAEYG